MLELNLRRLRRLVGECPISSATVDEREKGSRESCGHLTPQNPACMAGIGRVFIATGATGSKAANNLNRSFEVHQQLTAWPAALFRVSAWAVPRFARFSPYNVLCSWIKEGRKLLRRDFGGNGDH